MQDALQVGDPLQRVEAGDGEGIDAGAQGLEGAAGPAAALAGHRRDRQWGQAGAQLGVEVEVAVAGGGEADAGGQVFGGGARLEAAHL